MAVTWVFCWGNRHFFFIQNIAVTYQVIQVILYFSNRSQMFS